MSMTAREIFAARTRMINERRWHDLAQHYADDATVDMPFAIPVPVRLRGRAEIERHLAMADGVPLEFEVHNVIIHETLDPEVIIAEYDYRIRVTTTGHERTVANIQIFRVRDGEIVETRDYHDHRGIGEALQA
jgi:ketosteroid isomerase-like protein